MKRFFAMLLAITMVVSMLPAGFAEEAAEEAAAVEVVEETPEVVEVLPEEPEQAPEAEKEIPEEAAVSEEVAEEAAEEAEVSEEAVQEAAEETEEVTAVTVSFDLGGVAACIAVLDAQGNEMQPEAPAVYALLPGEYTYSVAAEGYMGVEAALTVAGEDQVVTVELNAVEEITVGYESEVVVPAMSGGYVDVEESSVEVLGGKSVKLHAEMVPAKSKAKLVWKLAEGDEYFASVSSSGKLTAKNVTNVATVKVIVSSSDKSYEPAEIEVTIIPRTAEIAIVKESETARVDGSTVTLDVNSASDMTLTAVCMPDDSVPVEWQWGKSALKNAVLEANGNDVTVSDVELGKKSVTISLTAVAQDGSGTKSSVKVKLAGLIPEGTLYVVGLEENDESNPLPMRGGESRTFKIGVDVDEDVVITDKSVAWELVNECDSAYASITSGGKLTTKPVARPVLLALRVYAKANPDACRDVYVMLYPAVTAVNVDLDCDVEEALENGISWKDYDNDPKNITLNGESVQLTAAVTPSNANPNVVWKSSNPKIATVSESGLVEFVEGEYGKVTITATAADGSGKKDSFTITRVIPITSITITGTTEVLDPGKKTTLKAVVNEDATDKKVYWYWYADRPCAPDAITISNGVVTAKNVTQQMTVYIFAANAKDSKHCANYVVSEPYAIILAPKSGTLRISSYGRITVEYEDGTLENFGVETVVNNQTLICGVNDSVWLHTPNAATWSSSNKSVATVVDGQVIGHRTGTVTITAKSKDGKVGRCTVKVVAYSDIASVIIKSNSVYYNITSGKKLQLTALNHLGSVASNVKWVSEDTSLATVSSTGVVTAKSGVTQVQNVRIYAMPKYGLGDSAFIELTIRPAATLVNIIADQPIKPTPEESEPIQLDAGDEPIEVLNNRTIVVDIEENEYAVDLGAIVYPDEIVTLEDGEVVDYSASGMVTWKSSNTAVATVNLLSGEVTLKNPGTVTITCTASDGSGVKASVTLKVIRAVERIEFETPDEKEIGSGCKEQLVVKLYGTNDKPASDTELVFEIAKDDVMGCLYASVSSKGLVTAKKVTNVNTVRVHVYVKNRPSVENFITLKILPKSSGVNIWHNGKIVNGKTIAVQYSGVLLQATVDPYNALQSVKWSVNKTSIAEINEKGELIFKKPGTVTVKAVAADGSGKSATVKVRLVG